MPYPCAGPKFLGGGIHKLLIMGKLQGLRPCNFQGNSWKSGGGNYKLHIMGKLQGLRPCNFQWNSWKLGTSISFLLWENCRGFAPAIFRGTLGNWVHP